MSISRHHTEWLSLVPVSGPFLSLPVLMEAFPQGLDAHDPEHARLLRLAFAEWDEGFQRKRPDPAVHDAWIQFVLTKTLEFDNDLLAEGQAIPQTLHAEMAEHHELLRPNIVINDPATKKARLLIQKYSRSQDLNKYVTGSRWKASPDTRMTELLHATGVRLGLVTNGEHWMLVDAPKRETTGYASWYASLWLEEKITLRAFRSLLSLPRFFGVADDETIEALLTKSASNQQEVTDQLGYQVRRAVEMLIQSLDKADQDHGRELLKGVDEAVLYESALTVMMRLVFLFCAEERELIPTKPFPVYEQNYSVSTISTQLREIADQQGEELLERRYDGWPRLLTAFRAVYGGLRHDDVHIPAYGGSLFNPDRFPFLEGRKLGTSWRATESNPIPVNNRTVLHLLEALQLLQIKVPGGGPAEARRLSFRALDIEQIGHVYEGLLDHTAKRATEPFLGLTGTRSKEPEIPVAELEKLLEKDEADLFKFLKGETGRSQSALKKSLGAELDSQDVARLRTACQGDEDLWNRLEPFAGLIRNDTFGYPWVVPTGSVFVTAGTDRRSSGTHYTPRSLTEPIVQYTLEPLVYVGPAGGKPKAEWKLKSAKELLDLKICDMACGSGAFLVQAARYMSDRLLEAWEIAREANPDVPGITPEGTPSTGKPNELLIPDDPAECSTFAMRIIAQRCLYGVDVNQLATEMAKLSVWLLTLAKDKPFEFLDHAIRCGDSLVGLHDLEQLRHYNLKPDADDAVLFKGPLDDSVDEAINLRLKLEDMPANTVEDVEAQEKLLAEAEDKIGRLRCAADLLVAGEFWGENAKDKQEKVRHAAFVSGHCVENGLTEEFEEKATKERRGQRMFHWPLEFPEVIVNRGGFNAFVGNPPFLAGRYVSGHFGHSYSLFLFGTYADTGGQTDLCAYFFRRAWHLIADDCFIGLLATNSISEGDTRRSALEHCLNNDGVIHRAMKSQQWPGDASLHVSAVHLTKPCFLGEIILDGYPAVAIDVTLSPVISVRRPEQLKSNDGIALKGTGLGHDSFLLSINDGETLSTDPIYKDLLKPFIGGKHLVNSPSLTASHFCIDFGERGLNEVLEYPQLSDHLIERQRLDPDRACAGQLSQRWWRHRRPAGNLYSRIAQLHVDYVVCKGQTAKAWAFARLPSSWMFDQTVIVFVAQNQCLFGNLQSTIHEEWILKYSSTHETRRRYSPSDCFENFPLCKDTEQLQSIQNGYEEFRNSQMAKGDEGLTAIYNRFHAPDEVSTDFQELRDIHVEMDQAVAAAYGWDDLALGHGFHETKQGICFTISKPARREVLQRLLKLNHERYEEEVKQGLHSKTKGAKKKTSRKKKSAKNTTEKQELTLFDMKGTEES